MSFTISILIINQKYWIRIKSTGIVKLQVLYKLFNRSLCSFICKEEFLNEDQSRRPGLRGKRGIFRWADRAIGPVSLWQHSCVNFKTPLNTVKRRTLIRENFRVSCFDKNGPPYKIGPPDQFCRGTIFVKTQFLSFILTHFLLWISVIYLSKIYLLPITWVSGLQALSPIWRDGPDKRGYTLIFLFSFQFSFRSDNIIYI